MSKVEVNTIDTVDNTALTIKQNDTTAMTINTSKQVGIGTTSPNKDGITKALTINSPVATNYSGLELSTADTLRTALISNSNGGFLYTATDIPLVFQTNNVERARFTSAGLHIGGTGSANALDDYEEGDWTPVFSYSTTTPSFSYVNRYGRYTKIGRMVMINFSMNINSIATGSASGDIQISGLPFTSKNPAASGGGVMVYGADVYSNTYDVNVNINDNATQFTFLQSRDAEGWINLSSANDAGQMLFQGSIVYDTDS